MASRASLNITAGALTSLCLKLKEARSFNPQKISGCGAVGSAPGLGPGGREFEPLHSGQRPMKIRRRGDKLWVTSTRKYYMRCLSSAPYPAARELDFILERSSVGPERLAVNQDVVGSSPTAPARARSPKNASLSLLLYRILHRVATRWAVWGISSVGRASALHAEGQRFESAILHHHPIQGGRNNDVR